MINIDENVLAEVICDAMVEGFECGNWWSVKRDYLDRLVEENMLHLETEDKERFASATRHWLAKLYSEKYVIND